MPNSFCKQHELSEVVLPCDDTSASAQGLPKWHEV
nr:MAG TPA: Double-stranded RNA binding domain 2 [Caudoviricetes sp.]DAP06791.1 MAG TPA: Double-stranded RNA binding domain 2 [Caudoviricetes sp.]DAT02282.1 MAG TPA: Double-stranded RNA binding domain 2 [Caudoviricetes sp.]DAW69093.1 MAG TPA: Double-stranded RNA binding domain 2 [Caudoviricetes sp.]